MNLASSELTRLFDNKEGAKNFVLSLMDEIESGYSEPLAILAGLKRFEYMLKVFKELGGYEMVFADADRYEKTFTSFNAEFQKRDSVRWDFSECDDKELISLDSELSKLNSKIKARQDSLKALAQIYETKLEVNDTGIKLPVKKSSESIAVTLK